MLLDAEKKAEALREDIIKKAEHESKAELARAEANAKLKAKYKVLESKEAVMKQVLESAEAEMKKEASSKKYPELLHKLATSGGIALGVDAIELVLPKGQGDKIDTAAVAKEIMTQTGKKVSVTLSKDTVRASGGLIVRTTDGLKIVDNTFEARLERLERTVRDRISSMLFKAEK